mgnify:CR=1 FL=1
MIEVGIVGGTGYTGVELLRLLSGHPEVMLQMVTSRDNEGTPVADMYPSLRGHVELKFTKPDPEQLGGCDVVFFATPNGTAMQQVPALLGRGVKVIDLAADFRLQAPAEWAQWYGMPHACPELLNEAIYGLPELNRERVAKARLIANPGCYPTAVILALLPLLEQGWIELTGVVADAKSGVSGAGRKASLDTAMGEMGESFKAYGLQGHRHWPEILQAVRHIAGDDVDLTFVPHLVPMVRGIEATLYTRLQNADADPQRLYERRYQHEPFIDVLPPGSSAETRSVRGSNMLRLALARPRHGQTLVVSGVIDNLVKGAAGQAVQNMNLMCGLPETMGLHEIALVP